MRRHGVAAATPRRRRGVADVSPRRHRGNAPLSRNAARRLAKQARSRPYRSSSCDDTTGGGGRAAAAPSCAGAAAAVKRPKKFSGFSCLSALRCATLSGILVPNGRVLDEEATAEAQNAAAIVEVSGRPSRSKLRAQHPPPSRKRNRLVLVLRTAKAGTITLLPKDKTHLVAIASYLYTHINIPLI